MSRQYSARSSPALWAGGCKALEREGDAMGIERLNEAARAAGFAMATDDEMSDTPASPHDEAAAASRSLTLFAAERQTTAWDTVSSWLRSCVPSFGGRAPA